MRQTVSTGVVRYVCALWDPSMLSNKGADEAALQISYTDAPAIDVETAEQLLLEVKRIMDQLEVPFFLRQGTCLGAIRDNALIAWDDDMDIGSIYDVNGVNDSKIESVASAFRDNDYYVKIEHGDQYISVTMMKSSTRIDWSCYKIINGIVFHYPGIRIPARVFKHPKEIDFIGTKFFVPNPPEDYLEFKYGVEWITPKKTGFEKDVLALVSDAPTPDNMDSEQHSLGKLRVLDHEAKPVPGAEIRIASVGNYLTNDLGYANVHLPKEDWYALVIKHGAHEEVLYMERMTPEKTYTYKSDRAVNSGRFGVLSSE